MILLIPSAYAMTTGLNQYTTFENYLNISNPNKTYALSFLLDDIANMVNSAGIFDVDNDGVNELVVAENTGYIIIYNWSGMKDGLYEVRDGTDRGTYDISTAMGENMFSTGVDNDGDGYKEFIVNTGLEGKLYVFEWNGTTLSVFYSDPTDRGSYRSSPVWCDIDSDGDYDIFDCTYEGVCRSYIYDSGTFSVVFTDADRGSYNYGDSPICADLDNDGDKDLAISATEGYTFLYNYSGSALTYVNGNIDNTDYGSYYLAPIIGDFLGIGKNYMMLCDTALACEVWDCTGNLLSCTLKDTSNDMGSTTYVNNAVVINLSNKHQVLFSEQYGATLLFTMSDATTMTARQIGMDIDDNLYTGLAVAKTTVNDYEFILKTSRYLADVAVSRYDGISTWNTTNYYQNIEDRFFSPVYYAGFLNGDNFVCGQLNHLTPEDECIVFTYLGIGYVFTYQNITEYRQEIYSSPEVSFLDIMPRDSIQYIPKGQTRTYCLNEKHNVLRYSLGGGQIEAWANVRDDDGTPLSNPTRITDGVITTAAQKHSLTTLDYTSWDSGDQYMLFNMSKPVQLGELKYYNYFSDNRNPYKLSIEISETDCTNPVFKTVHNDSDGDISGAGTYEGFTVRFVPQNVQCIKIRGNGAYYFPNTFISTNIIVELEGYYANNCTFYTQALGENNADIGDDYNISVKIFESKTIDSPNYVDGNYQAQYASPKSFIMNIIDQLIIWIKKY